MNIIFNELSHTIFIADLCAILIETILWCTAIQSDGRELAYWVMTQAFWLTALKTMDQLQEILLGHAVFATREYGMTQLPSYCTFH